MYMKDLATEMATGERDAGSEEELELLEEKAELRANE
jgi:hypothetical protein